MGEHDATRARVTAPMQGTIVTVDVVVGQAVHEGHQLMLIESMKMHHTIEASTSGLIARIDVVVGQTVMEGELVAWIEPHDVPDEIAAPEQREDPAHVRPDLAEVVARHEVGLDASRPDAVARRRSVGRRTARENVAHLLDEGTFVEYGAVVIAAQRRRRALDDLIARTPADGMVGGIGSVNGHLFAGRRAQVVAVSYDYTVLAGTQGTQNHRKKDKLFEVAEQLRLPVVFFTEGGGGRPGDTDALGVSGLDCWAFHYFARLSGLVPLVGINAGYCFAGNAAILGCCDVVIATADSNIGMGGPAMIEGGGLGVFAPTEIGPMSVQQANGVVDIAVADEHEAVEVAKRYLSYFQGAVAEWTCADQRVLRHVIPEDRKRSYDVRTAIEGIFDTGSVLELRRDFGLGMVTALARMQGRPVGIVANNPHHLAGAIDSDGADKAARFMQLCDAFDIPLVTLVDTPGMMVGPEVEKTALVRHCTRLFVVGANVSVPMVSIVLRKSYGLGAQAMMGGSTKAPVACVAWPTGEFGGMGLEGAVRLGYRHELEAIADPVEREATFQQMVDRMYQHGKALNAASHFEIDDVIDPADTRRWISTVLESSPPPEQRTGKKRPNVDTW
jgi:acetyl-CoA carboxylase carboxyltransferase component